MQMILPPFPLEASYWVASSLIPVISSLCVPTCRVRLCKDCFSGLTPRDLAPRATFHDSKHQISGVFLEETRRRLLTVGRDRVIKVWDLPAGVF